MPVASAVHSTERFLVLTITDPYTIEDWRAAILATFDNPVFQQRRALLVDRRDAPPASADFVGLMLQFFAEHRDRISIHTAIVAADDGGFGMARMTALRAEFESPGMNIRAFREYDAAVAWLIASR